MPALAVVFAAAAVVPIGLRAAAHTQHLFVRVVDENGRAVRTLSAADFKVTSGSRRFEVARAALAADLRHRVALLVDNGFMAGASVGPMRAALDGLVAAIPPADDLVLGTLSPQFRVRVKPTARRDELSTAIGMLFTAQTSGTALIDGIVEIDDRFVKNVPDRLPVFVIITSDSPETSGVQIEEFNRRVKDLVRRGAVVYAVVVAAGAEGRGNEQELCLSLTRSTGGTYDPIATATALPDRLRLIAGRIANATARAADEYLVEFTAPDDVAPIDVGVGMSGVSVHASFTP